MFSYLHWVYWPIVIADNFLMSKTQEQFFLNFQQFLYKVRNLF